MSHIANEPEAQAVAPTRRDGWTPFLRRLFLEVLAETGRVSQAVECCQMSKQSAYALRARDQLFAASWDAACELARAPLADALYEKALDGVTETLTKDGEVVAERHRYDSRLSIAVLHRLDKRCDRAFEQGATHLALVRHWDQWMALVGRGEEQAITTFTEFAPHGQLGQLPQSGSPTTVNLAEDEELKDIDLTDRCWKEEDEWVTDFAPPATFEGWERGQWGDYNYLRACTIEEAKILDADREAEEAEELADEESLRDAWFTYLSERHHEETEVTGD